ncbi:MAG: hypothetical protein KC933_41505, partial [Myxococcales bacterium]|nr:hypothetical protein [Myxococcales bacterium]
MRWLDGLLSRSAPPTPPPTPAPPEPPPLETHHSAAVEEIVATAGRRERGLSILDLGPARPSTFTFLTPLARTFRVVDLEAGLR